MAKRPMRHIYFKFLNPFTGDKEMKKIAIFLMLTIALIGCSDKTSENIIGNGQTVREFLSERGRILPQEISKGDKFFSEVIIVYGPPPEEWSIRDNRMIWVTGGINPDSMISFKFNLCARNIIAQR
ncbi:MAG: hypothetical protein US30_C0013G0001 [Candidatus Moranbacteria bacterium GW2011_GWF2_36_839]|nr:MAG: hypothetical protein US27_C0013G0001 [Candidatus Moranbacteria bacterium GW2011_GWF1_36_78]KKQ16604.1 MAG: hypothetical protein US30_C0013G0001 [Candidatus Moranbacteria bacterium GW2011_GWF2_36_839]